jgi:hypothetical protein
MKDHNSSSHSSDAPDEPVAISLDDWSVQPASLDEWIVASPSAETVSVKEPQPVSLDDWSVQPVALDDWAVPAEPTIVEEEETKIDDTLQEQRESSESQQLTAVVMDEPQLGTSLTELDLNQQDDCPVEASESAPNFDEVDEPLNIEEEEINLPLSEEHLDLDGPIDFSEQLFEDDHELERLITPTRTMAYDLSKEATQAEDAEDRLPQGRHTLLTKEEDLGLDIDELELPGTDNGHFELEAEEPIQAANFESELDDEPLFDPPTTVTIQESTPLTELEELELNSVEENAEPELELEEESAEPQQPELESEEVLLESDNDGEQPERESVAIAENTEEDHPAPENLVVQLQIQDLVKAQVPLIELSQLDLATSHQLSVVKLQELDLREQNTLPVIKLSSNDLAGHHRVVTELTLDFFETHSIERNELGVILLSAHDLADPSPLQETQITKRSGRPERIKKTKVRSESKWDDQRIIKVCLMAIAFFIVAIPSIFYFKFSWTTISEARYESIKEKASGYDWYTETMFQYRTEESSWNWFGRQKLNSNAYEKVSEDDALTWLKYSNSGRPNSGDSLD